MKNKSKRKLRRWHTVDISKYLSQDEKDTVKGLKPNQGSYALDKKALDDLTYHYKKEHSVVFNNRFIIDSNKLAKMVDDHIRDAFNRGLNTYVYTVRASETSFSTYIINAKNEDESKKILKARGANPKDIFGFRKFEFTKEQLIKKMKEQAPRLYAEYLKKGHL